MIVKCSFTQYAINDFAAVREMNDIAEMIQQMQSIDLLKIGSSSVYKISMNIIEELRMPHFKHTAKSECDFYIADLVRTDKQIDNIVRKQCKETNTEINIIPKPVGVPAILTGMQVRPGSVQGFFKQRFVPGGVNITWHILDPKTDIVVDKNLHQIYPKQTGAFPAVIQRLLQNTK